MQIRWQFSIQWKPNEKPRNRSTFKQFRNGINQHSLQKWFSIWTLKCLCFLDLHCESCLHGAYMHAQCARTHIHIALHIGDGDMMSGDLVWFKWWKKCDSFYECNEFMPLITRKCFSVFWNFSFIRNLFTVP